MMSLKSQFSNIGVCSCPVQRDLHLHRHDGTKNHSYHHYILPTDSFSTRRLVVCIVEKDQGCLEAFKVVWEVSDKF